MAFNDGAPAAVHRTAMAQPPRPAARVAHEPRRPGTAGLPAASRIRTLRVPLATILFLAMLAVAAVVLSPAAGQLCDGLGNFPCGP